jgi:hypothetical protein
VRTPAELADLEQKRGLSSGSNSDALFEGSDTWKSTAGVGGLDSNVGDSATAAISAGAASETHGESVSAGGGLIPIHWVCAFFAGSVPSEQACLLLDWAIVSDEKYAGMCSYV